MDQDKIPVEEVLEDISDPNGGIVSSAAKDYLEINYMKKDYNTVKKMIKDAEKDYDGLERMIKNVEKGEYILIGLVTGYIIYIIYIIIYVLYFK